MKYLDPTSSPRLGDKGRVNVEALSGGQYAHRRNDDGTLDSVCKLCCLTVARAYRAVDLTQLEFRHICQPVERRKATRIAHRVFDMGQVLREEK